VHGVMEWMRLRGCSNVLAYVGLGLINVYAAPIYAYTIPGGLDPITYIPLAIGAITFLICLYGYSSATPLERIARLLCIGTALLALIMPISAYMKYQDALLHRGRM
jgi:purine-cytosine permease-like protein